MRDNAHSKKGRIFSRARAAVSALAFIGVSGAAAFGATYTLDDAASPISATFDGSNGRIAVTVKATSTVWTNGSAGGGSTVSLSSVNQTDATHLSATGTANSYAVTIAVELNPSTGDLTVTLSGADTSIPNNILYPYALFPADGSGAMVAPFDSGYVVPADAGISQNSFNKFSARRMEWFGGVDADNEEGWIAILEPHEDMQLAVKTSTVNGASRLGGVPQWQGSNSNPAHTPELLSYDRRAVYRFFTSGGYVGLAKHFRQYALSMGWLKTLVQKRRDDPEHKVDKLIGAPVIYLWGDGRAVAMLDALQNAGIDKALIQISVDSKDQNLKFPNEQFAGGAGWARAVRDHGYLPGFYDI